MEHVVRDVCEDWSLESKTFSATFWWCLSMHTSCAVESKRLLSQRPVPLEKHDKHASKKQGFEHVLFHSSSAAHLHSGDKAPYIVYITLFQDNQRLAV